MMRIHSPWVHGPRFDSALILLPPIIAIIAALTLSFEKLPLWGWLLFVLGIDVAHVYSTLFKTYFHSEEYKRNQTLFIAIPLICWAVGVFLYTLGPAVFWSVLAYLAVFHFIRQQYGLMRLYSRGEDEVFSAWMDKFMIYSATVYPIIFWHAHERSFHWFIDGDFFFTLPEWVAQASLWIYLLIIASFVIKEAFLTYQQGSFNLPKNLVVLGTAGSWYVGIVLLDGDFTFTVTNVVAHGIPYMALIWAWSAKNQQKVLYRSRGPFIFLGVILTFAYLEEGMWAGLIWREHLEAFNIFAHFPQLEDAPTLSWVVPLLALPQATHYVLDGFIWKLRKMENF